MNQIYFSSWARRQKKRRRCLWSRWWCFGWNRVIVWKFEGEIFLSSNTADHNILEMLTCKIFWMGTLFIRRWNWLKTFSIVHSTVVNGSCMNCYIGQRFTINILLLARQDHFIDYHETRFTTIIQYWKSWVSSGRYRLQKLIFSATKDIPWIWWNIHSLLRIDEICWKFSGKVLKLSPWKFDRGN